MEFQSPPKYLNVWKLNYWGFNYQRFKQIDLTSEDGYSRHRNFLKAKKTKSQLSKYLQSHVYVSCAACVVAVAAVQLHPKQAGLLKKMRNPLFDYTKFRLWKWYPQKPHSLKSLCMLLYRQLIHAIFFIGFPWSNQYLQTAIPPSFWLQMLVLKARIWIS